MNTLDLINLYERLVREKHSRFYKISRRGDAYVKHRKTFSKLNEKLKKKDISPDDFIRIQFSAKGYKPYPNQLLSKVAMQRYLDHISCITSEEINRTQESYLRELCEDGYTLEEALQFDIFYYYFRCSKLKDYPKNWLFLAQKEIEKTPELKNIKL
jgi:hypothetical protein